ncbi:hypothetical protein [Halosegnis marinus]|uniref:Nudix hydrolase domain-containing protein n=1 Tax=Halosegnis marinus TaxID=3034023 RepID=A0ABD5ZQP9_9EURY|nr:hypothetical protein [Halosegnis sp. DT85]
MGGATRDRVTARLAQLRGTYDAFDIRQTTVSVAPAEFERMRADAGGAALAEVAVENAAGEHLLIQERDGGGWERPTTTVGAGQPLAETVCAAVERRTGVRPTLTGLDRAAIVCVDCAESDASAYQLQLRLSAVPEAGEPVPPAAWRVDGPADLL